MAIAPEKPSFLPDTGPLSVLCGFLLRGKPFIQWILQFVEIVLPDDVIFEAGKGKINQTISPLLNADTIKSLPTPAHPLILDTAYGRDLGLGERSVIKTGLATGMSLILDDQNAFVVACRFGLRPLGFQDFIVRLVREYNMPQDEAVKIVKETSRQFPAAYLAHTLDMLS